jgi:D-alanine-D-alanine ligase
MNTNKTKIVVLCGGRSGEHEVSLQSAKSVISAIDRGKYDVEIIGIRKDGSWHLLPEDNFLINADDPSNIALAGGGDEVFISPTPGKGPFFTEGRKITADVVFPVLHGTYGEDGTLQGMLDMLSVAYVGADYLGSAAAMDKDIAKRVFVEAGIPTANYIVLYRDSHFGKTDDVIAKTEEKLNYPVFVKPANLGSSVGISKVTNKDELTKALDLAWKYDTKLIVEEGIDAREIECALLGNHHVEASELGEIIPSHSFYSYEAKYLDPNGADLVVGADVEPKMKKEIQETAKKAFRALACEGMARADFLVEKATGKIYINELNTIPGFTNISMYPKLWEKSGLAYSDLIDRLIQLAIKRHETKKLLKTDFKK